MIKSPTFAQCALAVLSLLASSADAQVASSSSISTFTSLPAFTASAGATHTETFSTGAPGAYSSISTPGFVVTSTDSQLSINGINYFGTGDFVTSNGSGTTSATLSFADPITALGFRYTSGSATSLSIDGVGNVTGIPISGYPTLSFFGIISGTPFTSVTFRDQNNGLDLDNVMYGPMAVAAVPEPATWAMMLLGFGAIGLAMRGHRRRELRHLA